MLAGPIGMAANLAMQIPGVSESARMTGIKAAMSVNNFYFYFLKISLNIILKILLVNYVNFK